MPKRKEIHEKVQKFNKNEICYYGIGRKIGGYDKFCRKAYAFSQRGKIWNRVHKDDIHHIFIT